MSRKLKYPQPETLSEAGPICPNCGHQFTADEPIYYSEDYYTKDECPECDATFKVEVSHTTSWYCEPIAKSPAFTDGREGE